MQPTGIPLTRRARPRRDPRDVPDPDATLASVRKIVAGPVEAHVAALAERPAVSAETVAGVLPSAVAEANRAHRDELAVSLEAPLTTTLRKVARTDASFLGEILAPTIGTAVRKAVADAIAAMMERMDAALERSVSVHGVQWRFEAWRTGRPFAEVVLLRTLVYRVEQVFLIHSESGIVLRHVVAEGVGAEDPDQVASMLAAIDAFVDDAFPSETYDTHVSQFAAGDLQIWVDREPPVTLAAVVRGVAPRALAAVLREARTRIVLQHGEELAAFRSDVTPFVSTDVILRSCLRTQQARSPRRGRVVIIALLVALVGLGGAMFAIARARSVDRRREVDEIVRTLESEPGIVVSAAERSDGHIRVTGLRDPLSRAPSELFGGHVPPDAELRLEPFYSLDPALTTRRIHRILSPPEGVRLTLDGSTLRAEGTAPSDWIERARAVAPALPGVASYDDGALRSAGAVQALRDAAAALEGVELRFTRGSTRAERAALDRAATVANRVVATAGAARASVCIEVVGHTDEVGTDARNVAVADARSRTIADQLIARGIPADRLVAHGEDLRSDAGGAMRARRVTFRVTTSDDAEGPSCGVRS